MPKITGECRQKLVEELVAYERHYRGLEKHADVSVTIRNLKERKNEYIYDVLIYRYDEGVDRKNGITTEKSIIKG